MAADLPAGGTGLTAGFAPVALTAAGFADTGLTSAGLASAGFTTATFPAPGFTGLGFPGVSFTGGAVLAGAGAGGGAAMDRLLVSGTLWTSVNLTWSPTLS